MSRIKYRIYGEIAEVLSYASTPTGELELEFDDCLTGYVKMGERTESLKGGKCRFMASKLPLEEYNPLLILQDKQIALPPIVRKGVSFYLLPPDEEYIRSLSLRTMALEQRVRELEDFAGEMRKKVYGTTIF